MKPTMMNYILMQPEILNKTYERQAIYCLPMIELFQRKPIKKIYLVGSGTSFHVATLAKKYFENFAAIEVQTSIPTAFARHEHRNVNNIYQNDEVLVLAITQTGTSYSTINALQKAKEEGYTTAVFTQDTESAITEFADLILEMQCEKELVPPETQGYTSAVLSMYLMAIHIAKSRSLLSDEEFQRYQDEASNLLKQIKPTIEHSKEWFERNKYELLMMQKLDITGYGYNYTTAIEATLKVSETMKRKASGYEMEEFIHGPEMGYDSNNYAILIASDEFEFDRSIQIHKFLKTITNHVFIITNKRIENMSDQDLFLPFQSSDSLSPILFIIPFQILSALACEALGIDTTKYPHPHEMLSHTKDTQFQ